ncbi:MAG TPA: hypothetical protein VNT20_13735 [Flavisolibacter sp.]|jgi:hypothetical protein|nr:hypothetical protein [Flavisolibacter sp.]
MKTDKLCIVTISLAKNKEEEKLLIASLKQLATLDIPVYITDGGSSKDFVEFLHGIPHFKISEAKGLWPQAKMSITQSAKSSARFIFYTEPDKLEFFTNHLKKMLERIKVGEQTGVILASRSAKGFSTFPSFQQMTETAINNCCKEVIGKETDYCYGPFLFNTELVSLLEKLDDNIGWGWRPFAFAMAHRLGLDVISFEDDFNCPRSQREDDATERIYRMKQLTQNINGITHAATMIYLLSSIVIFVLPKAF